MQQLLISVLSDLNNTSPDITASAVISTDGLPIATMLPTHLNADRVGAMSATLLALGNRSVHELACGELDHGEREDRLYFAESGRRKRCFGFDGKGKR